MKKYLFVVLFVLFAAMLAIGCTGSNNEKTTENQTPNSNVPASSPAKYAETVSSTDVYKVGDTASDNLTKITLNGERYANTINEQNNKYRFAEAGNGSTFLILDITLENISPNRTRSYAAYWHYKILSPDGYTYNYNSNATYALSKALDGSDVMPGTKRRGEIAFEVPSNSTGLQLQFMWDPLNNHDAVLFKL